MPDFAFYSTDIDPTTDPANADPAPATLVALDQPPYFGEYDLQAGSTGRGSVQATLGGHVIQDFGVFEEDERISFSESDALSSTTVTNLKTLFETVNGEYYFTDGHNVWRIRFARPDGFIYRRNLLFAHHGEHIFSYEINLVVVTKEI